MNSKERVRTTFSNVEPDRVPVDYEANPEIDQRVKEHFGLAKDDNDGLLEKLDVDFRRVYTPYIGPKLHEDIEGLRVTAWGIRMRWAENESGGYWDYCDWPLTNATVEEVEAWPMPAPEDHDYSVVAPACEKYKDYYIMAGHPGFGDIINSSGMLRTMEQVLVDLITDDPAGLLLIDRKNDINVEIARRVLEAGDGKIDMFWIGEDLGTQIGPMISPAIFRKHIRPRLQKYVDLGKQYGIPVMIHSCGSSSWAFEDFIEMGIGVVDTLQPEAADMAPAYLKKKFGGRLGFHGMISTAGPVAYGTVDDVVTNVRETLEIMKPGGGYALSPTHLLQSNSPTENVVAMYEAAREFGGY